MEIDTTLEIVAEPRPLQLPLCAGEISGEFREKVEKITDLTSLIKFRKQKIEELQAALPKIGASNKSEADRFTRQHGIRQEFIRILEEEAPENQPRLITELIKIYLNLVFNELAYLQYKEQERSITLEARSRGLDEILVELWANEKFPSLQKEFDEMCKLSKIPQETKEIMDEFGTDIEAKVQVDGILFYVGGIRRMKSGENGRMECLFFSLKNGVLNARVAYKSNSGSEWRVAPLIFGHLYHKGNISYTVENKPCIELEQIFYTLESKMNPQAPFQPRLRVPNNLEAYQKEVKKGKTPKGLERLCQHKCGHGFRWKNYDPDIFNPKHIPDEIIPDFSITPLKILRRPSALRGEITLELYQVTYEGESFDIWEGIDREGFAKPERIIRTGTRVNSYGLYEEVLDLGILSEKSIDYVNHLSGLNVQGDTYQRLDKSRPIEAIVLKKDKQYADIRRMLSKLKFNQAYYKAKGMNVDKRLPMKQKEAKLIERSPRDLDQKRPQNIEEVFEQFVGDQLPLLPQIRELIKIWGEKKGEESKIIQKLLKDPKPNPSIILRSLLQLIQITNPTQNELEQYLEIIFEKFENGFPPEKSLYLALCREILRRWEAKDPFNQFGSIKTHLEPMSLLPKAKKRMGEIEKIGFERYKARYRVLQFMEKIGTWETKPA